MLDVQIADFQAGAKMRVMSEPYANQTLPSNSTSTGPNRRRLALVDAGARTPPPSTQLFSVTNGAPSEPSCRTAAGTRCRFPRRSGTPSSASAMTTSATLPDNGMSAKRYFGLSDPRGTGRQYPYIDTYDDACQSDHAR